MIMTSKFQPTLLDQLTLPYIRDLGAHVDVRRFTNRDELGLYFDEEAVLKNRANRLHLKSSAESIALVWWRVEDGEAEAMGEGEAADIDELRELIEKQTGSVKLRMVFDGAIA